MSWQLQAAKNRFSEVVQKATSEGPQEVTVRGRRTVVVLSVAEYDRLAGRTQNLKEFLLSGPPWDDDLVETINHRRVWPRRDIEL